MTKQEALDKFDPLRGSDAIGDFIEKLYDEGGFIASLEDKKKIDGITMLAQIHSMNPFSPKPNFTKNEFTVKIK